MTLSNELWVVNQDLAQACLEHPFVRGIGDGTLEQVKFAYYVGQDAFFLEAFARAYSIAAAKAPDWLGFTTFHNLASGVLEETAVAYWLCFPMGSQFAFRGTWNRHPPLY
jgi:thiaminase/transcriptional activator TenA